MPAGTQIHPDEWERLRAFLDERGLAASASRVLPLTGDASDRRYFRVFLPESSSMVLALHAEPFDVATLPFANVAALFRRLGVPIPTILGHSGPLGVLALEDLGDVTLQAHLGTAPAADHAALYRQAVSVIAVLQRRGAELASPEYLPYGITFDRAKLMWEMNFFVKYFVEAYHGVELTPAARVAIQEECLPIVEELAAEPRVLCHRDYHSRNLMLHQGTLCVIDFQDARMGPDTYDLASLLKDSYVDLSAQAVEDLIAEFLVVTRHTDDAREFRRRFDLMSLQRNLKALGTFGYQTAARGNPVYIQYVPRTLRHVGDNLERYPRFGRLRDLLAQFIAELG